MTSVESYYAAMAAALIDAEIMWRIGRMPLPEERSNLDRAVFKEALKRGLLIEDGNLGESLAG